MRVAVFVKASRASEAGQLPSKDLLTAMGKFNQELADAGIILSGEGLQPSSKGVRVAFSGKNRTVTDGPFAETKELIAGFWLWKVKSMAEAVEWIKRCPNPHEEDGDIEIRPLFEADDFGSEFTPELREQEASVHAQSLGLGKLRFENGKALSIVGLKQTYNAQTRSQIPQQWQRFAPNIGKVPGQVGKSSYGVAWNNTPDCVFDYLSGVEVTGSAKLPADFQRLDIPARRYAVFTHDGHVSAIPKTIDGIWTKWAPDCGLKIAKAPCFERYTEEFDPQNGRGGIEVWIPLET